ncbi:MAG: S8 family serine peptidase [Bacteroidota bacterium]
MSRTTTFKLLLFLFAASVSPVLAGNNSILLKSRTISTVDDFSERINDVVNPLEYYQGFYYRVIAFNNVLTRAQMGQMEATGIKLLGYIPHNAFYVAIPVGFNLSALLPYSPRTILNLLPQDKMSNQLRFGNIPDMVRNKNGTINMSVIYYSNVTPAMAKQELRNLGCTVLESFDESKQVSVSIKENDWQLIPACLFVKHIEPLVPALPDDTKGRSLHRSNAINTDFGAGRHYDASGVSIALADDGEVGPHIDYTGRMTNTFNTGAGGSHGDMTSGICMGAGNLDPVIRGMATGAQIYIYDIGVYPPDTLAGSYPHVTGAAQNLANLGTVVLSTSYSAGCNDYDAFASMTDRIMHNLRVVCPVWSAGNNQGADCGYGAGGSWGNITGGFKQGKNVIAVANLDAHEVVDATSSHGPASDGRLKPDISANGKDQMSIAENNTFQVGGGTSAACPSVAGVTAQCYQAYREITGQPNPDAALIKGCLLNSSADIGTAGPDYAFGYGRINGLRAVQTLELQHFFGDSLMQGGLKSHIISVPANTKQLKVLLIWNDPEADANAAIALVNNLDLTLVDPGAQTFNPWVLDPTPIAANLALAAVRRVDTLNNAEQVTIDNPAAGNYTINVNGTAVPFGPQQYYIVYETWDDNITLTYPIGGEGFVSGETEVLRWDAFGTSGNFQLDYSIDNGSTWNSVGVAPGTSRQYDWLVPNSVSGNCIFRVTRSTFSDVSDANFSIISTPSNLHVVWACVDSVKLAWDAVNGAAGYEASMLGTMYMDSVASGTLTEVVVHGVNTAVTNWFSVCALTGGAKGRRAIAIQRPGGLTNCSLAQDMAVNSIIPASGNFYDCGSGLDSTIVSANISNLGFNSASGFDLTYTINGANPVTETFAGTLAFGQTTNFTFATTVDLSAGGTFNIDVTLTFAGDLYLNNNTQSSTATVALAATAPLIEDFQGAIFPPLYWDTLNSNATNTWVRQSGIIGSSGTATNVAFYNNCAYNANGASDELITQLFDISGLPYPLMTFDVCYREYIGYTDALRIDISTDCGNTFVPTSYYKESPQLSTVTGSTGCFSPASGNDWRRDSVDLLAFAGGNIILKFINIGGYGNYLYIDNVNVLENYLLSSGSNPSKVPQLSVYPNPSAGIFVLDLKNIPGKNIHAEVFDSSGRLVEEKELKNAANLKANLNLSASPAGVYYLKVSSEEKVYHLRLTKI